MQVSHETIYKSLFIQARGVLRRELLGALRSRKLMRRAHGARSQAMKRSLIPDAVSIRDRPAEVEDRALPGHWEADLLMGGVSSRIATLVERRSRFVQLVRIGAKTSEDVVDALARQVQALPDQLMRTLTWDRGSELTQHARFTMATDVQVYFCDPHSPWQRGSNENNQRPAAAVLPQGRGIVSRQPGPAGRRRSRTQRPTPQNTRLQNTSRSIWNSRCDDRLRPPCPYFLCLISGVHSTELRRTTIGIVSHYCRGRTWVSRPGPKRTSTLTRRIGRQARANAWPWRSCSTPVIDVGRRHLGTGPARSRPAPVAIRVPARLQAEIDAAPIAMIFVLTQYTSSSPPVASPHGLSSRPAKPTFDANLSPASGRPPSGRSRLHRQEIAAVLATRHRRKWNVTPATPTSADRPTRRISSSPGAKANAPCLAG